MPLKVSEQYSLEQGDASAKRKRMQRKMAKNGHYERVRRPTGLEVYNDAARILEELLEKRIDSDMRGHKTRRNKTDPTTERVQNLPEGDFVSIGERSKTMPSRYREGPNDDHKKRELDALLKRDIHSNRIAENAESSADTEGDGDAKGSDIRRKKSLFKRAKERLIHTFHRDQKEGIGKAKGKEEDDESSAKKRKKLKHKKKDKVQINDAALSELKRHVHIQKNDDKSFDYSEEVEYRDKKGSMRSEMTTHRDRTGSRGSIIKSIKRPFRMSSSRTKSGEILNENQHNGITKKEQLPSPTVEDMYSPPDGDYMSPTRPRPTRYSGVPTDFPRPTVQSSMSSVIPDSEYNDSLGSLTNIMPGFSSNILDSPGEDIEYMDVDISAERQCGDENKNITRSIHAHGIKFHDSEGLLNLKWLADRTANQAEKVNVDIDETSVVRQTGRGNIEITTAISAVRNVVVPARGDDHTGATQGANEIKEEDKDELYGKIAQKLIEMADTYSASADQESAAVTDLPLNSLEKEIIECLRSGGDKYSQALKEAKELSTEETYERFRYTVQNAMGHELSWNHLAFLFFTTKGVVSAVGKGSQVANQATNFTLKYISDTFVNWIMDQGGFDSMLSNSESDPELD